jgi:pimeloyl-ACP methyl ester carboxylesterase
VEREVRAVPCAPAHGLNGQLADGQVILVAASMGGSYAMPFILHEPSAVVGFVPIGAIGSEDYMQQLHAMSHRLDFPVRSPPAHTHTHTHNSVAPRATLCT